MCSYMRIIDSIIFMIHPYLQQELFDPHSNILVSPSSVRLKYPSVPPWRDLSRSPSFQSLLDPREQHRREGEVHHSLGSENTG